MFYAHSEDFVLENPYFSESHNCQTRNNSMIKSMYHEYFLKNVCSILMEVTGIVIKANIFYKTSCLPHPHVTTCASQALPIKNKITPKRADLQTDFSYLGPNASV